jgi:hypothetical protein
MSQKRVMLISNKWWEADPLCWVLFHDKAHPGLFSDYKIKNYPTQRRFARSTESRPPDPPVLPRFTFCCLDATVEVWCLEELMNPSEHPSSTLEKTRVLPAAIHFGSMPDLVVAFGTGGSREGLGINGCVVVGRRVFIHDPYESESDRTGMWRAPSPNTVVDSDLTSSVFRCISPESRHSAEARFLPTPVSPANPALVLTGNSFISVGAINGTDYDDYTRIGSSTVAAFKEHGARFGEIGSIESTHGVVRVVADAPFLYVTGITDSVGVFNIQVTPRVYAQNTVAAHNAAIALAWLLPDVIQALPD